MVIVCTSEYCPRYHICAQSDFSIKRKGNLSEIHSHIGMVNRYPDGKCNEENAFQYYERSDITPEELNEYGLEKLHIFLDEMQKIMKERDILLEEEKK